MIKLLFVILNILIGIITYYYDLNREGEIRACKHSYLPDETRPKLSSEPPKENFE